MDKQQVVKTIAEKKIVFTMEAFSRPATLTYENGKPKITPTGEGKWDKCKTILTTDDLLELIRNGKTHIIFRFTDKLRSKEDIELGINEEGDVEINYGGCMSAIQSRNPKNTKPDTSSKKKKGKDGDSKGHTSL